jgi:hypothetical protein
MRTAAIVCTTALSLCLTPVASGERILPRTEILQIFDQLTSRPRKTWIPAGTIEATHQEYRAPKTTNSTEISQEIQSQIEQYQSNPDKIERSENLQKMKLDAIPFNVRYRLANEYTMNSSVFMRYDGDRFYWEIGVNSRQDSVAPDAALAGNFMADHFDLNWNQRRISAWDGEKYTTYTASGDHAVVDATGLLPVHVNGALTAGLIPWGYGPFTYGKLSAADTSATEVSLDGSTQIQMTLIRDDGSSTSLTLDPSRGYAVTAGTFSGRNDKVISSHCAGYQQVAGNWVPTSILTEQYDAFTNRLLSSDQWNVMAIDGGTPTPGRFRVEYQADTIVEYASAVTEAPSTYLYSHSVDTDRLLLDCPTPPRAACRNKIAPLPLLDTLPPNWANPSPVVNWLLSWSQTGRRRCRR